MRRKDLLVGLEEGLQLGPCSGVARCLRALLGEGKGNGKRRKGKSEHRGEKSVQRPSAARLRLSIVIRATNAQVALWVP